MATHLAFSIKRSEIRDRILIPKFYDPEIEQSIEQASESFETPELGDLLLSGNTGSHLGHWLPREHYGSGDIPYVRTSDLTDWRIRPDFKKGVSEEVYNEYKSKQDIRPEDIIFVAHGTYLVGEVGIVTASDGKLIIQDHVFKLRANPEAIDPHLLLASLSTSFVKRQVRTKQFSADIIDKIGDRHLSLRVPIPRDKTLGNTVCKNIRTVLCEQDRARQEIMEISNSNQRILPPRATSQYGFTVQRNEIKNRILIPKYYDPVLEAEIATSETGGEGSWVTLGTLVQAREITISGGIEVGKMAYGTGDIPFIRTSDLSNWQVNRNTKHGVSKEIYDKYKSRAGVRAGDVLVVRDGTYLVGSSAIVTRDDLPALYCGGILRLRVTDEGTVDPFFLLAALNAPLVRRQMRAKQFTRDVIDTLGKRLEEVRIPPPSATQSSHLASRTKAVIERKAKIKRDISATIDLLEPMSPKFSAGRPGWSMR